MGAGGSTSPVVMIQDPETGLRAGVETIGGKERLLTDTNISSVNIPQGQDPIPDAFYTVLTAGGIGDTVRHEIAGTSIDLTTQDSDLLPVDLTYTLIAEDVGDEKQLCLNIVTFLNAEVTFQNAELVAEAISDLDDDQRWVVYISSTKFSLTGEFYERPAFNSIVVTPTGTTTVSIDSTNTQLLSRAKPTSLARDPNNPHRLGVIGISGSIVIQPGAVDANFESDAMDGANNDMAGPASIYTINALADADVFIQEMRFHGLANGIKYGKFLNLNQTLSNGILVELQSDGVLSSFSLIKSTDDFKARWSSKGGWDLDVQSGNDHFLGIKDFNIAALPILKKQGTNPGPDDFIRITTQDNLNQVGELFFTAVGFKDI